MEKINVLKSIINGSLSGEYAVGSDEWLCSSTLAVYAGHKASVDMLTQLRKAAPDAPATAYKERMLAAGLWPTWRTKDGKEKAVGVIKGKAQLLRLCSDDKIVDDFQRSEAAKLAVQGHWQWRILCTYEVLRVTLSSEKSVAKQIEEMEADNMPKVEDIVEDVKSADTVQPVKPLESLPPVDGQKVGQAATILRQVLFNMELDRQAEGEENIYQSFIEQALSLLSAE